MIGFDFRKRCAALEEGVFSFPPSAGDSFDRAGQELNEGVFHFR
jgi:hypothetical protein